VGSDSKTGVMKWHEQYYEGQFKAGK
jgi:hypothetical protein